MSNKPVRLKDVADAVGVSINTVSCVLNPRNPGNVKVSDATRAAIFKAARELGYRRNTAAARLVGCRTKTLGILTHTLRDPATLAVIDAFEEHAVDLGYQCFIGCARYRDGKLHQNVEQLLAHGVDGLFIADIVNHPGVENALTPATDANLPLVYTDCLQLSQPPHLICANHQQGGKFLAAHLLDAGHRKMAFLGNETHSGLRSIHDRIQGIQTTLKSSKKSGTSLDLIWFSAKDRQDNAQLIQNQLRQRNSATVVLCEDDFTAIGLISGLRELGIAVPQDVCVTGYGDFMDLVFNYNETPLPWNPKITTVRQPLAQIGSKAAQLLIEVIEETKPLQSTEHLLDVELVVASSSVPVQAKKRR